MSYAEDLARWRMERKQADIQNRVSQIAEEIARLHGLNNCKSNSAADVNARDAAIAFSFAVQCGADPEAIRSALSRDSRGRASGPLGAALDTITEAAERGKGGIP
jgi:hypothetical protein